MPELSKHHIDHRNYPPGIAYMDGQYLPIHQAKISVLDYGFLHSDATYDVVHVWDGSFFKLKSHLTRFFRGLAELHMSIAYDEMEVARILHNCVAMSGLKNAYVEFICTRGTSPNFSRDPREAENRFIAFAIPFGSVANKEQLQHGLHLAVTDIQRISPASVDPTVKNYHWLDMVKGLYAAYERGADTAVLIDAKGNVSEGPGFNIFVAKNNVVSTPDQSVLLGVTRQTVFEICEEIDVECNAGNVSVEALKAADEVFVTSTAGGVMPVSKIDGERIGQGKVGELTHKITERYWQLHQTEHLRDPVQYGAAEKK